MPDLQVVHTALWEGPETTIQLRFKVASVGRRLRVEIEIDHVGPVDSGAILRDVGRVALLEDYDALSREDQMLRALGDELFGMRFAYSITCRESMVEVRTCSNNMIAEVHILNRSDRCPITFLKSRVIWRGDRPDVIEFCSDEGWLIIPNAG